MPFLQGLSIDNTYEHYVTKPDLDTNIPNTGFKEIKNIQKDTDKRT